ncbi:MAG: hypothetical protein K8F91_19485 [Candidatus Obscuribacterales bacterium]|nr:hypothetical protein [Candidatus Obscuribacterales bacterium]
MEGKRQKNGKPDCPPKAQSEARDSAEAVSEPSMAEPNARESTVDLMEEILEKENIKAAIVKVQKNGGAPGIDGMTVEDVVPYLMANWRKLQNDLLAGRYKPSPVRRVEISKPGGGTRMLGIPTVVSLCTSCSFLLG